MNQNSIKNNIKYINSKNDESSNSLKLGPSMILGPKFDIKKYINNINPRQYSAKKEKINLPPLFDNLYKRTKNDNRKYKLSTIYDDNLLSHKKNKLRMKSPSIVSTSISYNNNSLSIKKNKNNTFHTINNTKLDKNSSIKTYFETETNSKSLDLNNRLDKEKNKDENFNFIKEIKKIKKFTDISHKDKSIKNIMGNRVAFDQNNLDIIFEPVKVINDFYNFKQRELSSNKDNISSFLTESKDISKRNVIVKLLNNQKLVYNKELNERNKILENNKKTLDLYENNFHIFERSQKLSCRKIDDLLTNLLIYKRKLLREKYKLNSEVRIKEDERQKLLERIDELRIIAKFVTKVLQTDLDLYKIKIIPEYSSERLPNYELISNEVFQRFNFLLSEKESKNTKKEDINILRQIDHLNDSELLYDQFHKIEEEIINTLKNKETIKKETVEIKNEGKKQKKDILKRIENLENELNLYKSMYEREETEYEDIYKRIDTGEGEFDEIIKDLYNDVIGTEKINKKSKKNIININKASFELKNVIIGKEMKINKLIMTLEKYEKEDINLFTKAVHHRKKYNKEMNINLLKMKIIDGEKKKEEMNNPTEKLIFIQRKCEPPYQAPKKEKKIKFDPELVKKLEDDELMTYK